MLPYVNTNENIARGDAPLTVTDFLPSPVLSPYIRAYKIIECKNGNTNVVLPNSGIAMAFRFRGQICYINGSDMDVLPLQTISGLRKTVRLINYKPQTSSLVVLFKETGAAAFFRFPLHELYEESVSLEHFMPPQVLWALEERLSYAPNYTEKIAAIENFLQERLNNPNYDKLLLRAIEIIRATGGNIRMKKLIETLYISQDAFEKRFRKVVGTTPKQYASIVRLQSLTKELEKGPRFLDLAIDAGFFDQSHFNNEFKLFTGYTPSDFSRLNSFW